MSLDFNNICMCGISENNIFTIICQKCNYKRFCSIECFEKYQNLHDCLLNISKNLLYI